MTDQKFANIVAQIAHFLGAYSVLITLEWFRVRYGLAIGYVGVTIFAAVKEFWYDYHFEDAEERGSSLEDFTFYMVGLATAGVMVLLRGGGV